MPSAHVSAEADPQLETIRRALVDLRRLFQRHDVAEVWAAAFGKATSLDYAQLRLLDAVRMSDPTGGATVGDVARRLGIDPSRASRQVARAVANKLLVRGAAQGDGRKVVLRVTAAGARVQQQGTDLTLARIALALDAWPAADRARFATLFGKFAAALAHGV
ncbi:MAG: winged helix-turn-helix transcriptional regulator [Deltaproteobacteria bacterium]|nr:winged helix-turn-helix transcriptional regulator [Deltaproteobacteria bacterium]